VPIHFYCPLGHRLVVPDDRAGKKGRCPSCQQRVFVPVPNPEPSRRLKNSATLNIPSASAIMEDLAAEELGLKKPDDDLSL
jgi:hypothetical protein